MRGSKSLKLADYLNRRSVAAVAGLEKRFGTILMIWTVLVSFLCGLRIAFPASPVTGPASLMETGLPYALVAASPVAAYFIANWFFPRGILLAQPEIRLSRYGRWKSVDCLTARQHKSFGPTGMMSSLLIGMLLNVPVRSLEFLAAVPAMNGNAPVWGQILFASMTADVVIMNILYVVAFVMALRNVPWFPRLLLLIWGLDVCSQIAITHFVSQAPGLPNAVGDAMGSLLS
jgi:hypothetical protein